MHYYGGKGIRQSYITCMEFRPKSKVYSLLAREQEIELGDSEKKEVEKSSGKE